MFCASQNGLASLKSSFIREQHSVFGPRNPGQTKLKRVRCCLRTTALQKCAVVPRRACNLRRVDSCITQPEAQGPSRTCDESKVGKEVALWMQAASRGIGYSIFGPPPRMSVIHLLYLFLVATSLIKVDFSKVDTLHSCSHTSCFRSQIANPAH